MSKIGNCIDTEGKLVFSTELEGGGNGEYVLMGMGFTLEMIKFWN